MTATPAILTAIAVTYKLERADRQVHDADGASDAVDGADAGRTGAGDGAR